MSRDDEILQLLREIRDAQIQHQDEWRQIVRNAEERQRNALHDVVRAKRRVWVGLAIFVVILLGIYYLPTILPPKQIATDFPDLAQYSNPIPTPTLDGSYVLDYESSFGDLRARLAEAQPAEREILERLLAAAKDQLHNFRIDHGVITSGKLLIQEFRLISATTENGTLIGKAIWHEDIYDPGDCSSVNVRLNLEGDILKFYYSPDGDEPGEPIILRRAEP